MQHHAEPHCHLYTTDEKQKVGKLIHLSIVQLADGGLLANQYLHRGAFLKLSIKISVPFSISIMWIVMQENDKLVYVVICYVLICYMLSRTHPYDIIVVVYCIEHLKEQIDGFCYCILSFVLPLSCRN